MLSRRSRIKHALTNTAKVAIVVIVIIIIAGGGYAALSLLNKGTTSSSTSTTGSGSSTTSSTSGSSSSSSGVVPSTFTYEETQTIEYLDPQVSYYSFDFNILQNVYETLLAYKGTSGSQVTPWLASNYTISSNNKTATFNLRSGISFADGEKLNSTAVYFSLNRLLITDSAAPSGHGSQASWILQQLVNTSLSNVLSGAAQPYNAAWVQDWLNQNFVNITGTLSFNLNIRNPNAAFPYLLSNVWAGIVAPDYVMSHDLSTWTTAGYKLQYPTLSGNYSQMFYQYFVDMASTCNQLNNKGCGATYLDSSTSGSLAGTGPYTIQSVTTTPPVVTLQANPSYWGGPNNNMTAHIKTIIIKQVPQETTRELDLQAAAKSGQAMAVDIVPDSLYDVAAKSSWLNNNQLVSDVPGVTLYGPYPYFSTLFDPFSTNVTNPFTGNMYAFQPFADLRFRMAFADSVNMTDIMTNVANKLGQVATNVVPPGMNPQGTFNSSITPAYSYNPDNAAKLLISAMQSPITSFTYKNGTAAKSGVFNNAFGCTSFDSSGVCASPIPQSIVLYDAQGDTIDAAILDQIQTTINNISSTYNMGLTVSVTLNPSGTLVAQGTSGEYYMYALGWFADYPWVVDFLNPMYAPGGAYTAGDGWNLTSMHTLALQAVAATAIGNDSGLVKVTNMMNQIANQNVMYLWTQYPLNFLAMTSNVQGFYFNPALSTDFANVAGPQLFAPLY